jgi:hypothetical protein
MKVITSTPEEGTAAECTKYYGIFAESHNCETSRDSCC